MPNYQNHLKETLPALDEDALRMKSVVKYKLQQIVRHLAQRIETT